MFLDGAQVHGPDDSFLIFFWKSLGKRQVEGHVCVPFLLIIPLTCHAQRHAVRMDTVVLAIAQGIDPGAGPDGGQKQLKRLRGGFPAPEFGRLIRVDLEFVHPGIDFFAAGEADFNKRFLHHFISFLVCFCPHLPGLTREEVNPLNLAFRRTKNNDVQVSILIRKTYRFSRRVPIWSVVLWRDFA